MKKRISVALLSVMIVLSMAVQMMGCSKNEKKVQPEETSVEEVLTLGKGEKEFSFSVIDKDGNVTGFMIHTDKAVVGDALMELGLIEGDEGDYGLYVKKVNGITADYDKDGTYWAFYIDGEYAMTGVDNTEITAGASYTFKVEK